MYIPQIQINGVEVDRPNPDNGEGLQPSSIFNPIVDSFAENAAIGNMSHRNIDPHFDWEKFKKYGAVPNALNTEEEIKRNAAKYQSNWEKFGNALVQAFGNEIFLGTLKGFSDLYDVGYAALSDEASVGSYVNPIGQALEQAMDGMREHFEIYEKDPSKPFAFNDFGWYMNGLINTATTVSLFMPGIGVEKALGLVGKGAKMALGLNKELSVVGNIARRSKLLRAASAAGKINRTKLVNFTDDALSVGTNAFVSRTIENRQEAREVYKNNYDRLVDELSHMSAKEYNEFLNNNKGRGYENMSVEDIAKDIAEVGAFDTFKNDYWMLIMDALQYAGISKMFSKKLFGKVAGQEIEDMNRALTNSIGKGSTNYLQQFSAESLAKNRGTGVKGFFKNAISPTTKSKMFLVGMEGIGEGFEEGFQGVQSDKGKTTMDRMIDPTIEYRGLDSYLSDPEIWEQAFWGTIGSLVFTGLGAAVRTGQREKFIKEHKENLSENDIALLRMGYETGRIKELEGRIAKTEQTMKQLSIIDSGFNPFKPILDETGTPTGNYETLNDIDKQLYKQRILDEYLISLYSNALNHNNAELIVDFVNSDEFQSAMGKALGNKEDSNANINILDRFNKLVTQYEDVMYALTNKYETKNPFAVMATAEQIMRSVVTRDMAADMAIYEEHQLSDNESIRNRAKQYSIDMLQSTLEKIEKQIRDVESKHSVGYINPETGQKMYVSKNVKDARIRQLKRYRDALIKEIREQEGLSVLDEYKKEIDALNISDTTYNSIKNTLNKFRKTLAVDDTITEEDNKHARHRAEFLIEKVRYDSFIPKLNKEYEEAYSDIAYSMDEAIKNKLHNSFETVKDYILNSKDPIGAYYNIMRQDKDFMNSIDDDLRESIYALKLGTRIFSANPNDIFAGGHTSRFITADNELLHTMAIEKQKENIEKENTQSNTTVITEEQKKDEVVENPEQIPESNEPLPTPSPTPKPAPKPAPKKEEEKKETKEENKGENKGEKKKGRGEIFVSSTGEQIVIDDSYIPETEEVYVDDTSYANFVGMPSVQRMAEIAMGRQIELAIKGLDKKDSKQLLGDKYKDSTAYTNLINNLLTLSDGYNLFVNIKDANDRREAIKRFIEKEVDGKINAAKKVNSETIEDTKNMQKVISAIDAAINAYSGSMTIPTINDTELTDSVDGQIERLINNYLEKHGIAHVTDKNNKIVIDAVTLLKRILTEKNSGITYDDKATAFFAIYDYIIKSLSGNTKYSFYTSDIMFNVMKNGDRIEKVRKSDMELMNDLINDRYEDATDKLTKLDKILRISGSRLNEMAKEQQAVVYLLMNNPNEWKNVNIIIDDNKIKFLYKNKVEIGFLQKVEGVDKNNVTLRKCIEQYVRGNILNNEGFMFEITQKDGKYTSNLDDYFHALIEAACGISNNVDAKTLFNQLINLNIDRNRNNRVLDFQNQQDVNTAIEIIANQLVRNLTIGQGDKNNVYRYGTGSIQIDAQHNLPVKVSYGAGNSFVITYGNNETITSSSPNFAKAVTAIANNIVRDTNSILLHNYNKIKTDSNIYEDSIEYTFDSLIASYDMFKQIAYRNMQQQMLLQTQLSKLKEGEVIDFETLGFEGEQIMLDNDTPVQFSDVRNSIDYINNPIVIPTSTGVVTETGQTFSYNNPNVFSSDIGILLSDINNILSPKIFWISTDDMNSLYDEKTPKDINDINRRKLADAVQKEIKDLLYTYLIGKEGNASMQLDVNTFKELTNKLSTLLGGSNSNRGGLFSGVDVIRKWNDKNGGSIAIKFDNEPIVKDENGYNYEVVIITGSQNSDIKESKIVYRDENGKKTIYDLNKNLDKLAQLILSHIKFNKSHFTFKNPNANVGEETDYWYKKDGKFYVNIGGYKTSYVNYGAFLMNNNAARLRIMHDDKGNIVKNTNPNSSRTPAFTINFGEFITKQRTQSPVEGKHTYDKTAIDKLLSGNEYKEVDVRTLLENTDTNSEFIDMLLGNNIYNIKLLVDKVIYDKNGKHYARYNRTNGNIYVHKNLFNRATKENNPSAFIRRQLIHENIHRMIVDNNIKYTDELITELLNTFKATIEAVNKDKSERGKSVKKALNKIFYVVYDTNGNMDLEATIDKFTNKIYDNASNLSTDEIVKNFVEEWLVESITQAGLIDYLANTKYVINGKEIEVTENKEEQSLFQKIVDILLKLFGINLQNREKNSIFAQQYKLLNSMNPKSANRTKIETKEKNDNIETKEEKKDDTNTKTDEKKEEVEEPTHTRLESIDENDTEVNEEQEENTNESRVEATAQDEMIGEYTFGLDYSTNEEDNGTEEEEENDDDYNYSHSDDILLSNEEVVINNYANNPTCNTSRVITVNNMDDFLNMFPIEERALVAQNLENGNITYVCR